MTPRIVWFIAGSAAGVYATAKVRRVAYRLSVPGLVDQAAALGVGWRAFNAEVREGVHSREQAVAERLTISAPEQFDSLGLPARTTPREGRH